MTYCIDLEAALLGTYAPDRYIIDVRRSRDGGPDPLVFVHEYWHYLQNLTTLHGVKSFLATQQLVATFSRTMQPDGSSRGSEGLPEDDRRRIVTFQGFRSRAEGQRRPAFEPGARVEVVRVAGRLATLAVRAPGSNQRRMVERTLGAWVVKESVAHAVEGEVAQLLGQTPPTVPDFPYTILEQIRKLVIPDVDGPPAVLAALGTLMLVSRDPGGTIVPMLEAFASGRRSGASAVQTLDSISETMVLPELREADRKLNETDLPSILSIHRGRGASEKAVEFLVGEYRKGIGDRLNDCLFDLRPILEPRAGQDALDALLSPTKEHFVPCDMIFDGKMCTFHPPPSDAAEMHLSQYLRSFQAQQEFMMMHLSDDGTFLPSGALRRRCPFLRACDHPTLQQHSDNCWNAPWRNKGDADAGCWFTAGVSATMGPAPFRRQE